MFCWARGSCNNKGDRRIRRMFRVFGLKLDSKIVNYHPFKIFTSVADSQYTSIFLDYDSWMTDYIGIWFGSIMSFLCLPLFFFLLWIVTIILQVGSVEGQIEKMGLITTSLISAEKFPIIVPNSLLSSQVGLLSFNSTFLRLWLYCNSSYGLSLYHLKIWWLYCERIVASISYCLSPLLALDYVRKCITVHLYVPPIAMWCQAISLLPLRFIKQV